MKQPLICLTGTTLLWCQPALWSAQWQLLVADSKSTAVARPSSQPVQLLLPCCCMLACPVCSATILTWMVQRDATTLDITELPVRKWTQDYKEMLEGLVKPEDRTAPALLEVRWIAKGGQPPHPHPVVGMHQEMFWYPA